jgi:serine/threonine protein kinase
MMDIVINDGSRVQVFQVRKKDTGQVFAMKVMRKEKILEKDHCDYVKAERDVLTSIVHPYIVTLRYSFQVRHSQRMHCHLCSHVIMKPIITIMIMIIMIIVTRFQSED